MILKYFNLVLKYILNISLMSKYYVVVKGRIPGIYRTWAETQPLISGYSGAVYKSFKTEKEAQDFYCASTIIAVNTNNNKTIIYTDGSGRDKTNVCGFGVVILIDNIVKYEAYGRVPSTVYSEKEATNNVAELYAIYVALSLINHKGIVIYTDSNYSIDCCTVWINEWLKNGWKSVPNRNLIEAIYEKSINRNIAFQYVEAHSGIIYNERADELANIGRIGTEELVISKL